MIIDVHRHLVIKGTVQGSYGFDDPRTGEGTHLEPAQGLGREHPKQVRIASTVAGARRPARSASSACCWMTGARPRI